MIEQPANTSHAARPLSAGGSSADSISNGKEVWPSLSARGGEGAISLELLRTCEGIEAEAITKRSSRSNKSENVNSLQRRCILQLTSGCPRSLTL